MSYGMIISGGIGSNSGFHLPTTTTTISRNNNTTVSSAAATNLNFFKTHLKKSTISVENSPYRLSNRTSGRGRAATITNFYQTAAAEAVAAPESMYELLGIPESGSHKEIKQAYKQLALKYHPDVSPPERVEEHTKRFIMVKEAYDTLSNPQTRELYDRNLAYGFNTPNSFSQGVDGGWGKWGDRWVSQLMELKQRRSQEDSRRGTWGSQMRRQKTKTYDYGFSSL